MSKVIFNDYTSYYNSGYDFSALLGGTTKCIQFRRYNAKAYTYEVKCSSTFHSQHDWF